MTRYVLPACSAFLSTIAMAATGCGNGSTGNAEAAATFTNVYSEILQSSCGTGATTAGCHQSSTAAKAASAGSGLLSNLDFSSKASAYAGLVNMASMGTKCGLGTLADGGASGGIRVVPGNAQASLLYLKVADSTPPCGLQMPKPIPPATTASPLNQVDVTLIEDWINAGALNN